MLNNTVQIPIDVEMLFVKSMIFFGKTLIAYSIFLAPVEEAQ
jgi:hypothetical protein